MADDIAFSLDEARRARAEKQGPAKRFEFGGKRFTLPPEIPFSFSDALARGDWRGGISALLDGQADQFFAVEPPVTNDDLEEFAKRIADVYTGRSPGESSASRSSSKRTTKGSRQRSSASTG